MKKHTLYLMLGSNLGYKKNQIDDAAEMINDRIGKVTKRSSFYETEPWGFASDDYFLNLALEVKTALTPEEVMLKIGEIETYFGRERSTGYSSRTLDIDILFHNHLIIDRTDLKIPHPRLHERRFVLVPMDEIAPGLIHPVFHKTIHELLQECTDRKEVKKIRE